LGAIRQFLAHLKPLQRRRALTGAAALLVVAALLFATMLRSKPAEADAKSPPDPLSVLASRSPGARVGGALFQSKPQRVAGALHRPRVTLPRERVLAVGRTRPEPAFAPAPALAPAPVWAEAAFGFDGLPDDFAAVPDIDNAVAGPGFEVPPFAFGDGPGVPGTPGPGTPQPENPGGPGPAVPEPATWLMMIVGLGMIGQALRRASDRALVGRNG
jgi:hypothetical protein